MKKSNQKPNLLIHESSPYLQQHAYNPVEWHPWDKTALQKAKDEDKPILVSIGYSTCHWCHVMERESFEDPIVAEYMNEHFVNIKVDREERPDIDAIYMEAVQLVQNGQGGWPLNCFLTPDCRPFFGGTYFPPKNAYKRTSWMQVLHNLNTAFHHRRNEIEQQADKITQYIHQAQSHFVQDIVIDKNSTPFDKNIVHTVFEQLSQAFDYENGGFGAAPKFPGSMALHYCLNYFHATSDLKALNHLTLSLDKMIKGGIYDQLGGGFARYTVDEKWLIPHFEKMLYDNALLIGLMSDCYKSAQNQSYKNCVQETFVWINREMSSPEGGFYAALDADSEGVEGKFYVWSKEEIDRVLGDNSALFCAYYDVTETGNWEHSNILNIRKDFDLFCEENKLNKTEFDTFLATAKTQLLDIRSTRIRPGLDDKILLDWNAMMITALLKAYQAFGVQAYKKRALKALDFVLKAMKVSEDELEMYHSYKAGKAKYTAFLDDYALLIEALLEAYACTQNTNYLQLAIDYTEFVNNNFLDHKDQLYFFTSAKQTDVLLHKKSLYDSATPSGNSVMLHNLQKIGFLESKLDYLEQGQRMLLTLENSFKNYPQSFGNWANAIFKVILPTKSIRVVAADWQNHANEILKHSLFNSYVVFEKKVSDNEDSFVVCVGQQCQLPVYNLDEAMNLL